MRSNYRTALILARASSLWESGYHFASNTSGSAGALQSGVWACAGRL